MNAFDGRLLPVALIVILTAVLLAGPGVATGTDSVDVDDSCSVAASCADSFDCLHTCSAAIADGEQSTVALSDIVTTVLFAPTGPSAALTPDKPPPKPA